MPKVGRDPQFAARLQQIMDEKGLTRADVARLAFGTFVDERGYTVAKNRQMVGRWLNGTSAPKDTTRRKVADGLGVPLGALFPNDDPTQRPGSGVSLEPVDSKRSRLVLNVSLPTHLALDLIAQIKDHV